MSGLTFNAGSPFVASLLKRALQALVEFVELIDEDLLEGVAAAELIDFVAGSGASYCILLKIQVWS